MRKQLALAIAGAVIFVGLLGVTIYRSYDQLTGGIPPTAANQPLCSDSTSRASFQSAAACNLATGTNYWTSTGAAIVESSERSLEITNTDNVAGTIGWTSYPATGTNPLRYRFGDDGSAMQSGSGDRLQLYAYHGVSILGGRASTSAPTTETGSGSSDYSLWVHSPGGGLGLKVDGLANFTGNLDVSGTASSIATDPWHTVTYNTGYACAFGTCARYRRNPFGTVELEGGITRSSGTNTTMFTLPVGYRPSGSIECPASAWTGSTHALTDIVINTTGTVVSQDWYVNISLNGCRFTP